MPQKSASALEEERFLASEIASAVYFTAHLRVGPHEKYSEQRDTYEEAKAAGVELKARHSRFGRSAIIYAVTPRGDSIPCTDSLVAMARAL